MQMQLLVHDSTIAKKNFPEDEGFREEHTLFNV